MKELYLLKAGEISELLKGQEHRIMDIVAKAYTTHGAGDSALPHSVFLRFPDNDRNRIIGLPAYLGGATNAAGMKWISSFPDNINHGMERASALIILNNMENGHVEVVLESSIISAKRTAASAALAAGLLHQNADERIIGFVGCGRINREISLFLKSVFLKVEKIVVFDEFPERAQSFLQEIGMDGMQGEVADSIETVLQKAPLVSFATTAGVPYLSDISACTAESTILNISLRDFSPEVILSCDNIVDDLDHVCRERTAIHLTEQKAGNRDFVRSSLAEIIEGRQAPRVPGKTSVFSPFGLGVLDLALACQVRRLAEEKGMGSIIEDFLP